MEPIPNFSAYVYDRERNRCHRKRDRRLITPKWSGTRWYSMLRRDDGRMTSCYHDTIGQRSMSLDELIGPARPIANYPHYLITPYGAVWRIGGDRYNHQPRLLSTTLRGDRHYIQLQHESGKRHSLSVHKLTHEVWGHEALETAGLT